MSKRKQKLNENTKFACIKWVSKINNLELEILNGAHSYKIHFAHYGCASVTGIFE